MINTSHALVILLVANEVELPMLEIDKLIELSNDTSCRAKHQSILLEAFWLHVSNEYPELADKPFMMLLQFSSSYLCECVFFGDCWH